MWLGMVGSGAIAAISVAFPVLMFIWAIGEGITMGGSALVARYAGRRDAHSVSRVTGQVALLLVVYYTLVIVLLIPLLEPLLKFIGTPAELVGSVYSFIFILALGMPLTEWLYAYCMMLQSSGNTITSMKIWSLTLTMNLIADPILILGLGMFAGFGLKGAAVAMVASRAFMALYVIYGARNNHHGILMSLRYLRPDEYLLKRLLKVSLPITGERMLMGIEQMVLVALVAPFGAVPLAAYGIANRLIGVILTPGWAMSMAATAGVGQNLGAGKINRAYSVTWLAAGLTAASLIIVGLAVHLSSDLIVGLFTYDEAVIEVATDFLRIISPTFGFAGAFIVLGGVYRALERTVSYLAWTFSSCWVFKVPLAFILSSTMGISGIWLALAIAPAASSLGAALWLKKRCLDPQIAQNRRALYSH